MAESKSLYDRLQAIEEVDGVFPTSRGDRGRRSGSLSAVARDLENHDLAAATRASGSDLDSALDDDAYIDGALDTLASSEILTEQLACFTRAGFNFFRGTDKFRSMSLDDRRASGGSGAIRRVVRSENSLLLETARIIIGFVDDVSAAQRDDVLARHNLVHLRDLNFGNACQCAAVDRPALEACMALFDDNAIAYAEPDFVEAVPQRFTPNDPEFAQQWHHGILQNEDAWDVVTGDPIRLAVIDNGFDVQHADLRIDPAFSGWYRSTPDGDDADFVHSLAQLPNGNHGTACAGMAGAIADNGLGGCGVAFNAALSVIACVPDQVGTQLTLARALAFAADPALEIAVGAPPGADVISCSLGPNGSRWQMRQVLSDAIDFVAANGRNGIGAPLFWAVTNGNFPISDDEVCSHPETIAVGRSTLNDLDDGSGFGPELDFLAPGVDVWIPAAGGGYHTTTGTSFAAPCAAGVGALVLARDGSLPAAAVRQRLRDTADKVGNLPYDAAGRNDRFGYGRINSPNAL